MSICRANITHDKICIVTDDIDNSAGFKEELPAELQHLKNIIQNNKDNSDFKLLIFADYDNSFNDIINYLNDIELKHSKKVMGSAAAINNIIRRYKSYDINDKIRYFNAQCRLCKWNELGKYNRYCIVSFCTEQKDKTNYW